MSTELRIYLFGSPRFILAKGQEVQVRMVKSKAILAYLAISGQEEQRTKIAGLLWSDMVETSARANLRAAITNLRKELGDYLISTRQTLTLNYQLPIWVDAKVIEGLWTRWKQMQRDKERSSESESVRIALRRALADVNAEFLGALNIPDAPLFEEWMLLEREKYGQLIIDALAALTDHAIEEHALNEGIETASHILRLDPGRETAHRQLIQLHALNGNRTAALQQFEKCRQYLLEEFGVQPGISTTTLVEKIRQGQITPIKSTKNARDGLTVVTAEGSPPVWLATGDRPDTSSNLPTPGTSILGRDETVQNVVKLLTDEPNCQLLTLVGPGGIGKTRLALEVALQITDHFRHGVYFASFAAVNREELIVSTIAESVNFSFYDDVDPQLQLLRYLNGKDILLVLDNFEHLVEGSQVLSEAVQSTPSLRILVTSQERLNLHEEWVFSVDGLRCPSAEQFGSLTQDQVAQLVSDIEGECRHPYSAIELFVHRARLVRSDFQITPKELVGIVRICQVVEGTPLGIELAAAWVKMLTCSEIADEIEQNLDFLTTTLRNVPQRHRSLRAVFDHAWKLLSAEEQNLFQKLAIFQGPFDRQAANEIADAGIMELVALVDKSLVINRESGQFILHGQLRQYSTEILSQNPAEKVSLQKRHCRYFAKFLADRTRQLKGGVQIEAQEEALAEIATVIEEVRAAWQWAVDNVDLNRLDMLVESLFYFYEIRSWFQEGTDCFALALERITGTAHLDEDSLMLHRKLTGKLLSRQGWFLFHLGQSAEGRNLLEAGLNYLEESGSTQEQIFVLNYLGAIHRDRGEYNLAVDRLHKSLAISDAEGELHGRAVALNILGIVAYLQGQYLEARRLCQESLEIKRAIGDQWGMGFSLTYLGMIARHNQDFEEAEQLFRESLQIAETVRDQRGMATCLNHLGNTVISGGALDEANRLYQRSLQINNTIGNELGAISTHHYLGKLNLRLGNLADAWSHFRMALQRAHAIGSIPMLLNVLIGVAELKIAENRSQQAVEVLAHINAHPASSQDNLDEISELIADLSKSESDLCHTFSVSTEECTDEIIFSLVESLLSI